MKRTLFFAAILILVLAVTVSIAAAQGNGPGNTGGNGNGNGGNTPQGQGNGPVTNMGTNCSGNDMVTCSQTGAGAMNQNSDEAPFGHTHMWQEESFGAGYFAGLPPAVEGELPDEVIAAMNAGIMDEYNAYAIYTAIIDQFGEVAPFVNIREAEAQHIAAWEFLFERYGIELPERPEAVEVPQFTSVAEACQFAADTEIANFGLYDDMLITFEGYPDITQVVTNLRDASQYHHLLAFERCAG